jgi:hypothetical protein
VLLLLLLVVVLLLLLLVLPLLLLLLLLGGGLSRYALMASSTVSCFTRKCSAISDDAPVNATNCSTSLWPNPLALLGEGPGAGAGAGGT